MDETARAAALLQEHFGVSANLTPLDGDRDANFLAQTADGERRVLKLMHPDCPTEAVDMQCAALHHLRGSTLNLPRVIRASGGADYIVVEVAGQARLMWLLSWCRGTLLADHNPHSPELESSFGRVMATLDLELADLRHPALESGHRWVLTRALDSAALAQSIPQPTRAIVEAVFARFREHVLPDLASLPAGPIHNDANDYNVLVNTRGPRALVDGLFDFGDMARQPLICEPAIALAYLILAKEDPLASCEHFLRGYAQLRQPSPEELALLLDLIRTRLAVSVSISSHRQLQEPDDPYITISQAPARAALALLENVSPVTAQARFRKACGWGD